MTKKKRTRIDVEELIARPWCYYCERDFDDLKILISHQKAKHFKCDNCGRRLNTAGGLSVHLSQVHKEQLTEIENAMESRKDCGVEIFGMEGIPDEILDAHKQRVLNEFYKDELARRGETGNPPPGGKNGPAISAMKKPKKIETPAELKQRLAAHRAKREAEKMGIVMDEDSGVNTPNAATNTEHQSPAQASSAWPVPEEYPPGHPALSFPPPMEGQPPLQHGGWPREGWPEDHRPSPMHAGFPPHGMPLMPGQPFSPHQPQQAFIAPPQPQGFPIKGPGFPPHPSGMPPGWKPESSSPVPTRDAPKAWSLPPPAPGLPARPTFEPPQMKQSDYLRMHHGRGAPQDYHHGDPREDVSHHPRAPLDESVEELIRSVKADVDRLNQEKGLKTEPTEDVVAPKPAVANPTGPKPGMFSLFKNPEHYNHNTMEDTSAHATPTARRSVSKDATDAKRDTAAAWKAKHKKKEKENKAKAAAGTLHYYDVVGRCPEERMAALPKYRFERPDATRFVLDEAGGAVTGVTKDQDTVLDAQNAH